MSHPYFFTWQAQRGAEPVALEGGQGAYMQVAGRPVLDLGALVYQANAGHGRADIVAAIKAQADELCLTMPSAEYPAKRALAEALLAKAPPGFSKVFFCLGGSEANENALKIARMHTGRYKTVSRYRSYHGATMGAVSLTGDWRRAEVEPGVPGAVHVLDLDEGVQRTQIPRVLELEGDVGAVFLEPVVGANGVLIPPPGYFEEVREACDRHGALLVIDEVLTGFGRTGRFFAHEHFGVTPDLITVGKALTAGYGVLGAVLVHERVARTFDDRTLACGLTNYAHPLGVAAALAALRVYDEERLVQRAADLAPTLAELCAGLVRDVPAARGHRSIGLLAGVDLDLDDAALRRLADALWRHDVFAHVKGSRQLRRRGGALVFSPPLCIGENELREGFDRVRAALTEATADAAG